ncbi:MAG: phage tail protein [Peptoanaerobacter stomatis]|uniref:phage tail protein n=1 Tax=Peptoanaerobacter stomatis TaxID=796937 RepID=UPI003F9F7BA4
MWDLISTIIKTAMENIKTIVNAFVGAFNWIWQNFGGTITTIAKNTWDGINKVISGVLEILKGIITAWTALIKGDWNTFGESLKTIAKGIWDIISGIFTTAINNLKTIVKNGLDAIVNFFKNLKLPEIKIPKIKLPHFRVSGSFSINPPKTPSFGVDWYKDGGIFTRPTIFNTPYGFKGVGEAGAEAVLPISKLDDIVANAIKKTGTGNAVYNINFNGDMQIRSDEDIRRLARELGEYVLSQNRALGGAY